MEANNSKNLIEGNITAGGNVHIGDIFNTATEKKVPGTLSGKGATVTNNFIGREDTLTAIREKFTAGSSVVLLNGEGGIGKTTLAAAYWDKYEKEYRHRAWLHCEDGIITAIRNTLPWPLGITEELNALAEPDQQYQLIKTAMANLEKDCLLILDNVNDEDAIEKFQLHFMGLNWHVLLTSRCHKVLNNEEDELYINPLPDLPAKELFKKYYTEKGPAFDTMLDRFLKAVGYNTLCIEIFSKNLKEAAAIGENAESFLNHLKQKGLFLGDNSFEVRANYAQQQKATTDDFLHTLYDLSRLTEAENRLLVLLALLPAENHSMSLLLEVFNPESRKAFKLSLDGLSHKGWLFTDTTSYRLSLVVQEILLTKNKEQLWDIGEVLVDRLNALFESDEGGNILQLPKSPADHLVILALTILKNIHAGNTNTLLLYDSIFNYCQSAGKLVLCLSCAEKMIAQSVDIDHQEALAIAYSKLGQTYVNLGNSDMALEYFNKCNYISQELHDQFPDNATFKNRLAIAYEKLGEVYASLGDIDKALQYYTDEAMLFEQLYNSFPDNVTFKNGLAVSYSKLGDIYTSLGETDKALECYIERNQIGKELHDSFPGKAYFKNGLAISYSKLGEIYISADEFDKALQYFILYNRIMYELYDQFPDNVIFKSGLAVSYARLGVLSSGQLLGKAKAIDHFKQSEKLWAELADAEPGDVQFQQYLTRVRSDLAELDE